MYRFLGLSLGILFIASLGVLSGSSYVSAASVFDDTIQLTETLKVENRNNDHLFDVNETNYMSYMLDVCGDISTNPLTNNLLNTIYDEGYWAVVQTNWTSSGRDDKNISFIYSLEPNASIDFIDNGTYQLASIIANSVEYRLLGFNDELRCERFTYSNYAVGISPLNHSSNQPYLFLSTFPFNPPAGYEGVTPPTVHTPSNDYRPHVSYTVGDNSSRKLTLINLDQNIKLPVGQNEITGEVTPKLHIKLYDSNDDLIVEEDENWRTWSTTLPELGQYKLEVSYAHPGVPYLPFYGVQLKTATFNFNYTGGVIIGSVDSEECTETSGDISCTVTEVNVFEECITTTAPYIDFPACIRNVGTFVNLLTFDITGFNNRDWSLSGGCHQLTHLGDWLNLDNQYVCPSFPANVRNIITPFVSFFLGAVTVGFLMRAGGNNNNG